MNNFEVDPKQVLELFSDLSPKKQSSAYKNALKKGAQILVKETRRQLKASGIKSSTHIIKVKNRKGVEKEKKVSLNQGIKYSVKKKKDDMATIHIMGDFRLKFFELGTERRHYTKNGKEHNTGSIKGKYFFDKSKSLKENEIFSSMDRLLVESIQKVASKKR